MRQTKGGEDYRQGCRIKPGNSGERGEVIDPEGNSCILPIMEALRTALNFELDLVEFHPRRTSCLPDHGLWKIQIPAEEEGT